MKDFSEIYQASVKKVYHFLLGLSQSPDLAEELTAETFYQAYLHIDSFQERCEIDTWLCQIAKNAYYKELKRRSRHLPQSKTEDLPASDVFQTLENRQQALRLHKLLHTMKDPYREVFTLHIFGELTFKEIADIFGKSVSWAKMTFYRAKARLIHEMEVQNGEKNEESTQ